MALLPLKLPPGMKRTGTKYAAYGRWYTGNLVRFVKDIVRPIGGWAYQSADDAGTGSPTIISLPGVPRGALGWEVAGGRGWQAYGTAHATAAGTSVQCYSLGSLYDITPGGFTQIFQDIADGATQPDDGLLAGGFITRSGGLYNLAWAGGAAVRKIYSTEYYSDDYEFYADLTRNATGFGEPGIFFNAESESYGMMIIIQDVDASTVDIVFRRRDSGGTQDPATLESSVTWARSGSMRLGVRIVNGVITGFRSDAGTGANEVSLGTITETSSPTWVGDATHHHVGLVQDAATPSNTTSWDNFTVSESASALNASNVDTTYGSGSGATYYGSGLYGDGPYGSGNPVGSVTLADVWHMDNFGNLLVLCQAPSNPSLYQWDPSTPGTAMTLLSDDAGVTGTVPISNAGLVVTPERFLVALGANGDARTVFWADRESLTDWDITSTTNEAGSIDLEGRGKIIAGRRGRAETLIWTDADLFSMRYQGGTFVYGFEKRGTNCGLVAPGAVAEINGEHVWMGMRGFYRYDGYVRDVPCEVEDFVFDDMNRDQRIKIHAFVNHEFDEITWYYPSSGSDEIDRYVTWNHVENHWTLGIMDRTASISATTTNLKPVLLSSTGYVYLHESGWDHSINQGSNATPYVESGPVEIGNGDNTMHVYKVIPDEANLGDVQASLYVSFYPMQSETEVGPFTVSVNQDARAHGRWARLKLSELVAGDWRVGKFRLEVKKGGRR